MTSIRVDLEKLLSRFTNGQWTRVTPCAEEKRTAEVASLAPSGSTGVKQRAAEEATNYIKTAKSFTLSTDYEAQIEAAYHVSVKGENFSVSSDDILSLCWIINQLFVYFVGKSAHYGFESLRIWKNPKLSLVSQPIADLIEEGKSIRFCRDRLFEMTSHANDGDRIKSLSLSFHNRLMFLTHSYVISAFYGLLVFNAFLLVLALFVNTTPNSSAQALGLLAILVLISPIPLLLSRIITHKWRGRIYSKFPWLQCLLTMVPISPWSIQVDSSYDENTFLRAVKFIENSSVYELINSVINFTLWKKHDVLRTDNDYHRSSESEPISPFEYIGDRNLYVWRKIESISMLSGRVFIWLVGLVPRCALAFAWGFLWLNVIMGFLGNVYIGPIPIYGINGNSKELAGSPVWIILDFTYSLLLIYSFAASSSALSMFRLAFHIHSFQIITFKQRLLMDRLRTESVNNNMKYLLNPTNPHAKRDYDDNNDLNRQALSRSEQTVPLEVKPTQWLDDRDLHEEYLYHQSVINRSAQNWQLVAACVFIAGISFFVVSLAALILAQNYYIFMGGLLMMLFLLFVVLRIAVLNAELESIIRTLKSAASSDWALYGGRDHLLKDFSLNPISFRLYGVEITFAWLITMVTAFFTANLSVFMFIYSTSLSSIQKSVT